MAAAVRASSPPCCSAVPILSPCAAPFVFLSGICVKAQNFIITLIAEHIPGTLRISGKYLPVTVVICILFFTLSVLLYRRKNKARHAF